MKRIMICVLLFSLLFGASFSFALDIPLLIKETQGYTRTSEMVHNGVPIAKDDNVTSTSTLLISDGTNSIPATFTVLGRWGGGKDDTTKPIRWVLVSFPASVSADSTETYYLRDYGTPATITNAISVTDGASTITVDTGSAEFVISETAMTLFDSITINGNALASGSGGSHSTIDGQSSASANAPTVTIERQNDHYVCIKSVGTYANTAVGDYAQPIHYRIRYEFFAGSPTAVVTHKFFWPGYVGSPDSSGSITIDAADLTLPDMTGYSATDVYATSSAYYTGVTGETATVSQDRRTLFSDAHQATVSHGTTSQTTTFATLPAVINSATNGKLVATIGNMQFFEPQAIESDSGGKITIKDMNAPHYFADVQGTWAKVGIGAVASSSTYSDIVSEVIAPVDHRLMAIPSASYLATTNAFDVIPNISSAAAEVQAWWNELGQTASTTETWLATEKFQGLMTWGSVPRYDDETGTLTTWDKVYSGAALTDYHNTWLQMTLYGLLSNDPDKLSDYSFAAARRVLDTQAFQVDDYANPHSGYMGWAPTGYSRFRNDFNSSHSYFENLYAYYFLTGDLEVVDYLTVGAKTRDTWYTRDNDGNLNDQTILGVDWIDYQGRIFYQAASIFDFLGHASDSRFLDDWKHMYNHTISNNILLLNSSGDEYTFFTKHLATSPYLTSQCWMDAIYTTEGLYRLWLEYGDITLGAANLSISRVFKGFGNSLWGYYRLTDPLSDGGWDGNWTNQETVTYTGDNIGGDITSVVYYDGSSDPHLYTDGKILVATAITRAGAIANDLTIKTNGLSGLTWGSTTAYFTALGDLPMGKKIGIAFSRMSDGVSYFDSSIFPPQDLVIDPK